MSKIINKVIPVSILVLIYIWTLHPFSKKDTINIDSYIPNSTSYNSNYIQQSKLNIQAEYLYKIGNTVYISLNVKNNSNQSVFVSSLDFTLSSESGNTINPTLDSVESFKGIKLQPDQSIHGKLKFETSTYGINYLNYNGLGGEQRIKINIQSD